jgi:hypothetical protein
VGGGGGGLRALIALGAERRALGTTKPPHREKMTHFKWHISRKPFRQWLISRTHFRQNHLSESATFVCLFVCMYVCMYCMYVCVTESECLCVRACVYSPSLSASSETHTLTQNTCSSVWMQEQACARQRERARARA